MHNKMQNAIFKVDQETRLMREVNMWQVDEHQQ